MSMDDWGWSSWNPPSLYRCGLCGEEHTSLVLHKCKRGTNWRQSSEPLIMKAVAEYLQAWFEL
jgi:hypothetical protein